MYIYLLHSFVLYPIRETGILRDEHSSAVWLVGMIFACIAISIVLTAPPIRWLFRPIIEPKPRWIFSHRAYVDDKPSRIDPTGSRRD